MFSKPWVRCLVCLVMVCVILINCSPIKVEASMTGTIAVGAGIVIASALIGLGVCAASDPSGFDGVVSSCQDFLADAGYVINGVINVAMLSPSQASFTYGLSGGLIDTIRSWIFDTGVVVHNSVSLPESASSVFQEAYSIAAAQPYAVYITWKNGKHAIGYAEFPFAISGNYMDTPDSTKQFKIWGEDSSPNSAWFANVSQIEMTNMASYQYFGSGIPSIVTDIALYLAKVAAPAYSLAQGYAEWFTNTVTVPGVDVGEPDQDEVVVYPVGIGQTYEETRDKAQTDVWAGSSSYVDTSTDTGVAGDTVTATGLKGWLDAMLTAIGGWFADVISGLRDIGASITSLPQSIADAVLAGITAIFVPSTDFLTAKVEAIRAEFAFADAIISTGEYISTSLTGLTTEPPVIYVNLGDTRGSYNLGGKVAFLDLRWYAEYKPVGDAIIAAFLWLCFAWRMYVKAPGIIRGIPGDFHAVRDISGKE